MKTKPISTVLVALVLIGGCSSYKVDYSSNECIDCQRLKDALRYLREEEHAEKVVLAEFNDGYEHSPGGEAPWEDIEKIIIQSAGCCTSSPHLLSKEWEEYNWLDCIWEYLEKENVQRIAFYGHEGLWAEITEPQKIKEVLKLLREAMEKEKDRFANEGIVVGHGDRMQIVTDKHKFIIPIGGSTREDDAIRGLGWTSPELRKQLWKWSCDNKVYKYDLPPKEQIVAVLVFPREYSPPFQPLALFGDKKMVEKILFENSIPDDPDGTKGYRFSWLYNFGIESKYEAGKIIPSSTELEPKKIFASRIWLEKIIDAYEDALKEAEARKEFPFKHYIPAGRIVFMTQERNYWKGIGIDENSVFDNYIKSEQLKEYFDELGLTKELLAGEPNKEN
jgi:hypothetical protein